MPKVEKRKLILLDSHAIIHRAYHALPEFTNTRGEPTGALYGLSTMLIKILSDLKPDAVVATFDLHGPTHRHEVYDAYKAGRKENDENLEIQLESAKKLFEAWGIPIYACPGFEADDVIGSIVEAEKKNKNTEIIIASGDMDTMQLVSKKKVQVYTLKKGLNDTILYDEEKMKERFGFAPDLLPDYKGLRGDPSDNIIGVKGIGEKTATSLITAFGTIENIYKALKKDKEAYKKAGITERVRDLLLDNEEEALFSKTLATIRPDAPVNFTWPGDWRDNLEVEKLVAFLRDMGFKSIVERLKKLVEKSDVPRKSTEVFSTENLPDARSAELRDAFSSEHQISKEEERELTLMLWVCDSNNTLPTLEEVMHFTRVKDPVEARKILEKELDKRGVREVYEEIEKPLIPIVAAMNSRGIKVDKAVLQNLSETYHKELKKLEKSIWKHAGEEFNINSPKVLGEIIFNKLGLGLKRQKKTPTGALSTKESELEKIRDKHPIIGQILEFRELNKLLSTYIDAIPPQLDANSRLHSTFEPAGTTTGRMASNDPNLQNIPIRSELGRAIRGAFVAQKGFKLVSLDYSQIELRIAAILSNDKKLVEIFKGGEDVHNAVAARVFKVAEDKVDREMRRRAKIINFGILYGMGVTALKANLGTDRKEAQEFYNNYFATFTELAQYLDGVKASAEKKGYTETMFGRKRYFTGFKSPLPFIRAQAERMAINAPIQGTEADIVKIAMKRTNDLIKKKGWENKVFTLLNVHDEIVYEVEEGLVSEVSKAFKKIMEEVMDDRETHGVPIIAETHSGDDWGNMN